LTAELKSLLEDGLKAMGLAVPEAVPQQLIDYLGLLIHWNKAFNLTAVRDPIDMVSKHLLDSLSVLPFIGDGVVADVGSGAGLPGIPLALSLPETRFVLIDSNGKKTRFLNQAKMVLNLDNVEVVNQRVEDYSPKSNDIGIYFDTIIARAYANTQDILKSTAHLQKHGTRILVMQGKLDEDIEMPGYELKHSHLLDVHGLDADRHLLEIIKI
jgi:16S rRNA (guanine527-N7)-methyltransferase